MAEILAPVGGREQLVAAVCSGADAIYLGAKNFNARRNASNFDCGELSEVVSYCHARNVKVHVTLNTLVMDSELPALVDEIKYIAESGADAVIVQDLAVAKLVKELCPDIEMHASTQMTIHNLSGVKMAKELGFSRVVLSRELSFDEIKEIAKESEIELEVFVHGALCMCMSGACYLSSMIGGRSGNRGLCAQPCRLDFRFGEKDHALSLKDMSYIEHLKELEDVGICSFKIEGRMKRPEYVAAAVTACKTALAGGKADTETLKAVFSRQGFTDGYYTGKRTFDMFGFRSYEDVTAADKVLKGLTKLYSNEPKKVPVSMELAISEFSPSVLKVSDGKNSTVVYGNVCEHALKTPTDKEIAERYISKTGGTPFCIDKFDFYAEGEPAISAGEINELRRNALSNLLEIREEIVPHKYKETPLPTIKQHKNAGVKLRIRAEKAEQIDFEHDAELVILPISEIEQNKDVVLQRKDKIAAELPVLIFQNDEEKIKSGIDNIKSMGIKKVVCENIGAIKLAKEKGMEIIGGHGLNILNSVSLDEYERIGVSEATLSFELSEAKIRRLGGNIPRGIIGYGYLPLMRTRACPIKRKGGCGDCKGKGEITDRLNKKFGYLCFERKYGTLLNSLPLWVGDKDFDGIEFMTLYFTTETKERCKKVYEDFKNKASADCERTNGLYFRELL